MLSRFRVLFGALTLLKTVDLVGRLPDPEHAGPALAVPLIALWALASVLLILQRAPQLAPLLLAATGTAITATGLYNHHTYLMVVVAAILGLFDDHHQKLLLKVQLSILYGFAAATKINGVFLSGDFLESIIDVRPVLGALAIPGVALTALSFGAVLAEGFLAIGLWFERTRRVAVAVGILLHGSMVPLLAYGVLGSIRLIVYSGLALAMYLVFFDDQPALTADTVTLAGSRM